MNNKLLGFRRGGKMATKLIVGYKTCGYTFCAMVNFTCNYIQVVIGNWQPHWNASKTNGNQHINKVEIKQPQQKPSKNR